MGKKEIINLKKCSKIIKRHYEIAFAMNCKTGLFWETKKFNDIKKCEEFYNKLLELNKNLIEL